MVIAAIVLQELLVRVDRSLESEGIGFIGFTRSAGAAADILTTIATSTLTFLGVVFSITIVGIQLSSQQFSPRVLRTFLSNRVTQVSLGAFVASFVYSLLVLRNVEPELGDVDRFVPGLAVLVAVVLALATVLLFIAFVHDTVHSLRAVQIIEAVTAETRLAIREGLPDEDRDHGERLALREGDHALDALDLAPLTGRVKTGTRAKVLAGIDIGSLIGLARRCDAVFVLRAEVGDFLPAGVPVLHVHGGTAPSTKELRRCFELTDERTVDQDLAFGLRQLVDIASRALSPGINDPTTAGQAVDRLVDLLRMIGRRPEPGNCYRDDEGELRLVRPRPEWDDLVRLSLTEIRLYGASSMQISRRLAAAYDDLEAAVADRFPERATVLRAERELLRREVERAYEDPEDRARAFTPDRMGMG
jgi:uncharacterized membrane protein